MGKKMIVGILAVLAFGLGSREALAQEASSQNMLEQYGLSLSVGGGVLGFTDTDMRDTADVGGLWDVRVGFFTNTWVGAEIAYQGGLQPMNALGLNSDAQLLSNALEADARLNFLQGRWRYQPYIFAGLAWKRYSLTNVETNLSSVNDRDDVMEIPMGVGIGFRMPASSSTCAGRSVRRSAPTSCRSTTAPTAPRCTSGRPRRASATRSDPSLTLPGGQTGRYDALSCSPRYVLS